MSLSHSPKIVTDGLVFYYDMNNTQKSWKGMTATNLVSVPTKEVLGGSNEFVQWGDIAPVFNTYGTGTGYSLSLDLKSKVPGPILVYMQNGSATKYSFVSQSVTATTSYRRFNFNNLTAALQDVGQTQAQLAFYGVYGTGRVASVKNVQIEKNAFATPFVDGVRTNTQSILDLTGKRTVTAANLVYGNDGKFSFNGSTTYITAPNTELFHGTNGFSYSVWANWASLPSLGTIFENGLYTAGILIRFQSNAIAIYAEYAATTYQSTMSFTPTIGSWYNLVLTREGNVLYLYANGVQIGTTAFGTSINIQPSTNLLYIGMSQHAAGQCFNGQIAAASIYNRTLSAIEVKQNFNALKGRYGL